MPLFNNKGINQCIKLRIKKALQTPTHIAVNLKSGYNYADHFYPFYIVAFVMTVRSKKQVAVNFKYSRM